MTLRPSTVGRLNSSSSAEVANALMVGRLKDAVRVGATGKCSELAVGHDGKLVRLEKPFEQGDALPVAHFPQPHRGLAEIGRSLAAYCGYGVYLDALHSGGGGAPPPARHARMSSSATPPGAVDAIVTSQEEWDGYEWGNVRRGGVMEGVWIDQPAEYIELIERTICNLSKEAEG